MNARIADKLREAASLLDQQQANPFRVRAYRRGAETLEALDVDVADLLSRKGPGAIVELPNIGDGIASAIQEIVETGRWGQLERLREALDPICAMQSVPHVGPKLARRIYGELGTDSLEALEAAAFDGTLQRVPGIGPERGAAIRASLSAMLQRDVRRRQSSRGERPGVGVLLDVDREYRARAAVGDLPTIAPRRFNPTGERWLPILRTRRGEWELTVLYSNSARAHELDRNRDWVVVYFTDGGHQEGQNTVVTERSGALAGRRVVRGRESDCIAWYAARDRAA